jgi:probable phosphoglycerate mutase
MLRIVLIRPGTTDYDRQGRIQGTLDIPLNEQGCSEVADLIEPLRAQGMEVIYSPESEPAQQTAECIAKGLKIKRKRLDHMENLDHGLWQGMLIDDVRRKNPRVYRQWQDQPETVCPPEGEMIAQAIDRLQTTLAKLLKKHKEGVIGLVVPEPLASLFRCLVKNNELGDLWKAALEHEHWEILEVAPAAALASSI